MLLSDTLRPEEEGRHYIALSLAEAETVRRILHLQKDSLLAAGLELQLRVLPLDFVVLDRVVAGQQRQLPKEDEDATFQVGWWVCVCFACVREQAY